MEVRRSINTKIWDDTWFMELDQEKKLLWIYLLTNSQTNMLGIYEISEKRICFDTGLPLQSIKKAFESFQTDKKAKYYSGYVILYNWIKNQSFNSNMLKSAYKELNKIPQNIYISVNQVFMNDLKLKNESLSKPFESFEILPKKEYEKEKEYEGEKEGQIMEIHNNIFRKLYEDKTFILSITEISKGRNPKEVQSHLNNFRLSLIAKKDFHKSEKDAREHFVNHLKYSSVPEIKEKPNPANSYANNPE